VKIFNENGARLLTVADAAKAVGVTPRSVHNWIDGGRLAVAHHIDKAKLVTEANLFRAAASYQPRRPRRGLEST
jgi:hypothetical protein